MSWRQCPKCKRTETELIDRRDVRSSFGSRVNRRKSTKSTDRTRPKTKVQEEAKRRMREHIENCDGSRD